MYVSLDSSSSVVPGDIIIMDDGAFNSVNVNENPFTIRFDRGFATD